VVVVLVLDDLEKLGPVIPSNVNRILATWIVLLANCGVATRDTNPDPAWLAGYASPDRSGYVTVIVSMAPNAGSSLDVSNSTSSSISSG